MARGYLGLGSNLGDRRAHLESAVARLQLAGIEVVRSSSAYDTEPVGPILDQPAFLNACLEIETELVPEPLLDVCKEAERSVGRGTDGVRSGPRVIDVDLLLVEGCVHTSPRLTLPHPEVVGRRFVLVPLLELSPGLALPDGTRLSDSLAALGSGQEVRLAGPPLVGR